MFYRWIMDLVFAAEYNLLKENLTDETWVIIMRHISKEVWAK